MEREEWLEMLVLPVQDKSRHFIMTIIFIYFFLVQGLELRACTLIHSTSPFV
jgi:hypothetical protein